MKKLCTVVLSLLALAIVLSCGMNVQAGTANEKKRTSSIGWETIGWCITADKIDVTKDSLPAASEKDIMTTTSKMDNSSATSFKLQFSGGVKIGKDSNGKPKYDVGYTKRSKTDGGRVITDHLLTVTEASKKKEVIAGLLSGHFNDASSHKEANAIVFDVEGKGAKLTEKDFNQLVNGKIAWKTETSGKYKGKKVAYVWAQTIVATYTNDGDSYDKDSEGYIKQYRSLSAWKNNRRI